MRDPDGAMVLLAEQDGPPLWVRIKSAEDSVTTMVELAGAVMPAGAKPEKPRLVTPAQVDGSSMSSNRSHRG